MDGSGFVLGWPSRAAGDLDEAALPRLIPQREKREVEVVVPADATVEADLEAAATGSGP